MFQQDHINDLLNGMVSEEGSRIKKEEDVPGRHFSFMDIRGHLNPIIRPCPTEKGTRFYYDACVFITDAIKCSPSGECSKAEIESYFNRHYKIWPVSIRTDGVDLRKLILYLLFPV